MQVAFGTASKRCLRPFSSASIAVLFIFFDRNPLLSLKMSWNPYINPTFDWNNSYYGNNYPPWYFWPQQPLPPPYHNFANPQRFPLSNQCVVIQLILGMSTIWRQLTQET